MRPAFSVIALTTLIGAGQGLFLALVLAQAYLALQSRPALPAHYYVGGSAIVLALLVAGLAASFFHLGQPQRAWRSAAMWRSSWLSREVIALPATMAAVAVYAAAHQTGAGPETTLAAGALGALITLALYVCTGMIYACIRFLQEWASSLTVINYTLLGAMSGFTLATVYAGLAAPVLLELYAGGALALTALACLTRLASLRRNARLRPKSTLQTAIGVRHPQIEQKAQGAMGGSFNTREFFHHAAPQLLRLLPWLFMLLAFALPAALLAAGLWGGFKVCFVCAFAAQFAGLLVERWYFFAQANHPQNLYYAQIS